MGGVRPVKKLAKKRVGEYALANKDKDENTFDLDDAF